MPHALLESPSARAIEALKDTVTLAAVMQRLVMQCMQRAEGLDQSRADRLRLRRYYLVR